MVHWAVSQAALSADSRTALSFMETQTLVYQTANLGASLVLRTFFGCTFTKQEPLQGWALVLTLQCAVLHWPWGWNMTDWWRGSHSLKTGF